MIEQIEPLNMYQNDDVHKQNDEEVHEQNGKVNEQNNEVQV